MREDISPSIGGQPRNNLAAIDASTGAATSWNPNVNALVYALAAGERGRVCGRRFSPTSGARRGIILPPSMLPQGRPPPGARMRRCLQPSR